MDGEDEAATSERLYHEEMQDCQGATERKVSAIMGYMADTPPGTPWAVKLQRLRSWKCYFKITPPPRDSYGELLDRLRCNIGRY